MTPVVILRTAARLERHLHMVNEATMSPLPVWNQYAFPLNSLPQRRWEHVRIQGPAHCEHSRCSNSASRHIPGVDLPPPQRTIWLSGESRGLGSQFEFDRAEIL
jgi:hypothetical protein